MAFAAAFSPVCCQPPVQPKLVLPSLISYQSQGIEAHCTEILDECQSPDRVHSLTNGKDASPGSAWARLQEQTMKELDAWKQSSEENRLKDALEALDAAFEALRLADEICNRISTDALGNAEQLWRKKEPESRFNYVTKPGQHHSSESRPGKDNLAASIQEAEAVVRGRLTVEGDVAMDACELEEVLHSVLLQVGEVKDVKVQCTRPPQQSFLGVTSEGYSFFGHQENGGLASMEFAFEVMASDPNDLEPLQETLMLEAACGGARHLWPMLAEQLCSDNLPTPRHLKVRIEVFTE